MPINYSKWDNIDTESESSNEGSPLYVRDGYFPKSLCQKLVQEFESLPIDTYAEFDGLPTYEITALDRPGSQGNEIWEILKPMKTKVEAFVSKFNVGSNRLETFGVFLRKSG